MCVCLRAGVCVFCESHWVNEDCGSHWGAFPCFHIVAFGTRCHSCCFSVHHSHLSLSSHFSLSLSTSCSVHLLFSFEIWFLFLALFFLYWILTYSLCFSHFLIFPDISTLPFHIHADSLASPEIALPWYSILFYMLYIIYMRFLCGCHGWAVVLCFCLSCMSGSDNILWTA